MQSAHLAPARESGPRSTPDRWPAPGWWPDAARGLLPGAVETISATAGVVLTPRPESVHSSRGFTSGTLAAWGLGELCENMELVVSELATNALRHGLRTAHPQPAHPQAAHPQSAHPQSAPTQAMHTQIRLSLTRRGRFVACAITDPGAAAPVLRHPGPMEPGGLGLHIVASLSECWGWAPLTPQGKIVWAVLSA